MFVSFFPAPRAFFWSAALWGLAAIFFWFFVARDAGELIGLANPAPDAPPIIGVEQFWSKPFIWFYIYYLAVVAIFAAIWWYLSPHPYFRWSVLGSALIVFLTYYWVQAGVAINSWYGPFYDLIQTALGKTRPVAASEFYAQILTFLGIALVAVVIRALTLFFINHYVFRWRWAMNDFYMSNWSHLRKVEGAAQRVQDDTMRFASNLEDLGENFINAVMTLIAFFPILIGYSSKVAEIPILGHVPYALVLAAVLWSAFGTGALILIGIKLPGLEFKNQRVEAAFRKELVYGEDHDERAGPMTMTELFSAVRRNYFTLYFHYVYFNISRFLYGQTDNIYAYIVLVPTMVAGTITLGFLNQVINAFDQVRSSFQYLVSSWPEIIKMISIYKRLRAFEATLYGQPLPALDVEYARK